MARDPRGVPDVVFKPTKYMNFVEALGKRKELEANRKMEKAKQLISSLPEAELGKYSENWRNVAGQAFQSFTKFRNETIALAEQGDLSREEFAKRRQKMVNMKMEIAGVSEDASIMGEKLQNAEKDLQEFVEKNDINMRPQAYIERNEGKAKAQNLKSILQAINVYSGDPLGKAEVDFNDEGKLRFSAPGVDAKSLPEYMDYREVYQISPANFEKEVENGEIMHIPVTKDGLDRGKLRDNWETFTLEYGTAPHERAFKKYYKQIQGGSDQEADVLWDKMQRDYKNGKINKTAEKYYENFEKIAQRTVKTDYGGDDEEGDDITVSGLPGSAFTLKERNVSGPGSTTGEADDIGKALLPENVQSKAIALEEGKHKINVSEADFTDDTGSKVEVADASVERLYKDDKGDYYALVKGIRKSGQDIWAENLIKLKDGQIGSLKESLGSEVKEMGFDEYFKRVTGARSSSEQKGNNTDKETLNSEEAEALSFIKSQSDQEVIDAVLEDYPKLKDYI